MSRDFADALLAWYRANRRDLPWRATRDPYAIWVSEVMLQQTTVATVRERWVRFLRRFPTVEALAAAPEDAVTEEWRGLGYYARARNLRRAAQAVAREHGGAMPRAFGALRALPGLGDYTAAAVASIAFGEPVAVFDANVRRVMARLLAFDGEADAPAAARRLREETQRLLPREDAGDFNQALMELGATLCSPRAPRCGECPVRAHCRAAAQGRAESYPRLRGKPPLARVTEGAAAIVRAGRVLVLRRAPEGSFANMWELPRSAAHDGEEPRLAAERAARELAGIAVEAGDPEHLRRHTVMRSRIALHVCLAPAPPHGEPRLTPKHAEAAWLLPREWAARPCSTTQHAVALWLERRLAL
jgi:A/G-specific adenine glycosylase